MLRRLVSLLALVLPLVCTALAVAAAQDAPLPDPRQTEAQACFQRGIELSQAGDDQAARASFVRSIALWPRVSSFFNLALVELKLGHGRGALRALAEFEQRAEAGEHDPFLSAAGSLRARALGLTGVLVLTLSPELAELRVDDEPFEQARGGEHTLRLDAGIHRIEARAPEHVSRTLELSIERGQSQTRTLGLQKVVVTPAHAPRARDDEPAWYTRRSTWWWTGGAVLLTGSVTTAVLLARRDQHEQEPYGGSTGTVF